MKKLLLLLTFLILCTSTFGQGLVSKDDGSGRFGFVDADDNFVIKPQYDAVHFDFVDGVACIKKGSKFALIDSQGAVVSEYYNWVGYFDDKVLCLVGNGGKRDDKGVYSGGKYGIINKSGKELFDTKYNRIELFNEFGIARVNVGGEVNSETGEFGGGKYGFINRQGVEVVAPKYTFIGDFNSREQAWVNIGGVVDAKSGDIVGGKCGIIDRIGKEIIPVQYSFVGEYDAERGIYWVNVGGKEYVADKTVDAAVTQYKQLNPHATDEQIREYRNNYITAVAGSMFDVMQNRISGGKFGLSDASGKVIAPVKYLRIGDKFVEGRAWVLAGTKFGFINTSGVEVVPVKYKQVAAEFHNGVAWVIEKSLRAVVDRNGKLLTDYLYSNVGNLDNGFMFVQVYGEKLNRNTTELKFGFLNAEGKQLTPLKYTSVLSKVGDFAVCSVGRYKTIVNNRGEEIVPIMLVNAQPFESGVARVQMLASDAAKCSVGAKPQTSGLLPDKEVTNDECKCALIDEQGVLVTAPIYDAIRSFSEGVAAFKSADKAGWLDSTGKHVVDTDFENVCDFHNGYALVKSGGLWGYADRSGKVVIECQYKDAALDNKEGVFVVCNNDGLWGGVALDNSVLIPAVFSSADLAFAAIDALYVAGGRTVVTLRQAKNYNIYSQQERNKFKIADTVPDSIWDF